MDAVGIEGIAAHKDFAAVVLRKVVGHKIPAVEVGRKVAAVAAHTGAVGYSGTVAFGLHSAEVESSSRLGNLAEDWPEDFCK